MILTANCSPVDFLVAFFTIPKAPLKKAQLAQRNLLAQHLIEGIHVVYIFVALHHLKKKKILFLMRRISDKNVTLLQSLNIVDKLRECL